MQKSTHCFDEEMHNFFQALACGEADNVTWIKDSKSDFTVNERLQVYAFAYKKRLFDAVITDYPATAAFLTSAVFQAYAKKFVTENPPRHWDLNLYSIAFANWLTAKNPAAACIAAVESTIVAVYWQPNEAALSPNFFSQISEEQLMNGRFIGKANVRLLTLAYAAEDFVQAYRDGQSKPLLPEKQYLLICKYQDVVKRIILENQEFYFLESLRTGKTLGESVENWLSLHPDAEEALLKALPLYFQRWFSFGIFSDFYH
jgi:hypothetical protein